MSARDQHQNEYAVTSTIGNFSTTRTEVDFVTLDTHPRWVGTSGFSGHRESEAVERRPADRLTRLVRVETGEVSTRSLMEFAEEGGAFDFWRDDTEDVYTIEDGEPV